MVCESREKIQGIRNIPEIKETNRFKYTRKMYKIQEIINRRD
jgi:hypothetical protein